LEKNQDQFRFVVMDGINILMNGIGGPLIPVGTDPLLRRNHVDKFAELAGENIPAGEDMLLQRKRLILNEDKNTPQAGIDAVA